MKIALATLLTILSITLCAPIFAQQITTHEIGPFTGNIAWPPGPVCPADSITFSGSVNVVAQVDTAQNTVDNLLYATPLFDEANIAPLCNALQ